ncbi:outer membrane beta-barrel protein [Ancylobacter sp. A5.8]|uniref:outer membrane protein n=1 Tax=Ancylobacter gelatini TaxID=2919920 RepID=UPI001F4E7DD6|nr:outer membrane beta-barrel protein [Ancylobacter gelatini]MCJ8144789.1 outer membrane beta-barrel protein [Ancylobacter gelatini]
MSRCVAFSTIPGLAALAAGWLAVAAPAGAADLGGVDLDASDLLAKAPQIEDTSGWYLRGDIGYVVNERPDWAFFDFGAGAEIADAWLLGLGLGVRANDWLRFDVTADYRTKADYTAGAFSAEYEAATLLGNVYVDLGTWHGLTPYVGAGAGAGYVSVSDIDVLGADIGSASGWGFAWAVMAGVAVELSPNWQLDIGYRYLSLDGVNIGGAGVPEFDQDAHEIRIGARYLID